MSRSNWKGSFINKNYIKKNFNKTDIKNTIMPRNVEIFPKLIRLNLKVYNGKTLVNIKVTEKMVGYKLGSFAFTRSTYKFKKIEKKTKK